MSQIKSYKDYWMTENKRESLYKLVKDITSIFDREKITYFADGGTLLGCYREKDVIAHDDDVDLWLDKDDYNNKLYKLYDEFMDLGYQIQFVPNMIKVGIIRVNKIENVVIDLFPYEIINDKVVMHDQNHRNWWPDCWHYVNDCFPLSSMKYGPLQMKCPHNGIPYLDRYYPNWKNIILIDTGISHKVTGDQKDYIVFNIN